MARKHIHVDPQDDELDNSPTFRPNDDTRSMHASCKWNGTEYSDGATVCSSHRLYECWNGRWVEISQC